MLAGTLRTVEAGQCAARASWERPAPAPSRRRPLRVTPISKVSRAPRTFPSPNQLSSSKRLRIALRHVPAPCLTFSKPEKKPGRLSRCRPGFTPANERQRTDWQRESVASHLGPSIWSGDAAPASLDQGQGRRGRSLLQRITTGQDFLCELPHSVGTVTIILRTQKAG